MLPPERSVPCDGKAANDRPDKPMLQSLWKESKGNLYMPEGKDAT